VSDIIRGRPKLKVCLSLRAYAFKLLLAFIKLAHDPNQIISFFSFRLDARILILLCGVQNYGVFMGSEGVRKRFQ
jgi:hypothetical protein